MINWNSIASYLAQKLLYSYEELYQDPKYVPDHVGSFTNTLPTMIIKKVDDNTIHRIYLWIGTSQQIKSANTKGYKNTKGQFDYGVVMTMYNTGDDNNQIEFYNKFEIIQECDPDSEGLFAHERINDLIVIDSNEKANKLTIHDLIQKGIHDVVDRLIRKKYDILAVYQTSRTLRRGKSTLFEDCDILVGTQEIIDEYAEPDDGSSDGSDDDSDDDDSDDDDSDDDDSDDDDSDADDSDVDTDLDDSSDDPDTDADEMLMSSESSDSSEEESLESDDTSLGNFIMNEQLFECVDIHNQLVDLAQDYKTNKGEIKELLTRIVEIGKIDLTSDDDDESDDDNESESETEDNDVNTKNLKHLFGNFKHREIDPMSFIISQMSMLSTSGTSSGTSSSSSTRDRDPPEEVFDLDSDEEKMEELD